MLALPTNAPVSAPIHGPRPPARSPHLPSAATESGLDHDHYTAEHDHINMIMMPQRHALPGQVDHAKWARTRNKPELTRNRTRALSDDLTVSTPRSREVRHRWCARVGVLVADAAVAFPAAFSSAPQADCRYRGIVSAVPRAKIVIRGWSCDLCCLPCSASARGCFVSSKCVGD
jgi:hypothetical protein